MKPITHPTRTNYTWYQTKFGADTMSLQYQDIAKHCVPVPTQVGKDCDIYIGVFGWANTSFTIVATADEGFLSPIVLSDQQPQSGAVAVSQYSYFSYKINVARGDNVIPTDIKFTLTPLGTVICLVVVLTLFLQIGFWLFNFSHAYFFFLSEIV
jgi:hypothetical protein